MLLKGQTIIWLMIYKNLKIQKICWRFSCHHHFWHRYQSGPGFSEMNTDADLIFHSGVTTDDRLLKFGYLFDLDGGPYRFKKVIPTKFLVVYTTTEY